MNIPILSLSQSEYAAWIQKSLGKGYHHALGVYRDWLKQASISPDAPWIEPQARDLVRKILAITDFSLPIPQQHINEGCLTKFLLTCRDGLETESVIIPMRFGTTLCISSQIGCRMGCSFCQTAKMGLLRHLTVEEIVAQVFIAIHHYKKSIRNIVFMGMGEPLDNFDAVMAAIKVLTCPQGLAISMSRITISTSGHVVNIYRMIDEASPALNLAVSVNAPSDEIRNKIMPINKRWAMPELKEAMLSYCQHPRREILAEYVLIQGINDSLSHAEQLAQYLSGLKVRVNLIPYNPQQRDLYLPPEEKVKNDFLSYMRSKGYKTLLRGTKGQKIMAACGQLGNKEMRKKLFIVQNPATP